MVARAATAGRADVELIWRWLETVVDPEIPVVSVVDLGIVRDVRWHEPPSGPLLEVTVTPTYSGCPATEVITASIREALRHRGIESLRIVNRVAPPWTTDWISESGRRKLERYGIAPPRPLSPGATPPCPRCGAEDTECIARFGSTPCKALYRCRECLEPFDYFKCH